MQADPQKVGQLLKTARGQLDGILRMVADDRYCIDILNQLMATESILKKVEREVLRAHMESCVQGALGNSPESREKVEELITVFDRLAK